MTYSMKTIRLELAANHQHPNGSTKHGYEIKAPLNADGQLDIKAWPDVADKCRFKRFWGQHGRQSGKLVYSPEGYWAFVYDDPDGSIYLDDEYGYDFRDEIFRVGEEISILEADDDSITYKVVSIEDYIP